MRAETWGVFSEPEFSVSDPENGYPKHAVAKSLGGNGISVEVVMRRESNIVAGIIASR
jgi:hypothetical protein